MSRWVIKDKDCLGPGTSDDRAYRGREGWGERARDVEPWAVRADAAKLLRDIRPSIGDHLVLVRLVPRKKSAPVPVVEPRIFSGDSSAPFWAEINALQPRAVKEALYSVCCKLQELEALVRGRP